jgi:LuxR family transcriptional regulator, quorum-sensing system regulator CviR
MDLARYLTKRDSVTLLEITSECLFCRTEEEFKSLVFRLQDLIDFDYCFGAHGDLCDKKFGFFNIKYPEYVLQIYSKNQYHLIDPIATEVFKTLDFVSWTDAHKKHPGKNEATELQREVGPNEGFTYATHDHDFASLTSFAFGGYNIDDGERTKTIVKTIVPHLTEVFKRICGKKLAGDRFGLTPREIEVLKWIMEGKSSWEISMIFRKSESVVNFHIKNIIRKLNAMNRIHAVSIAMGSGLIDL